jgi:hypothetical protein
LDDPAASVKRARVLSLEDKDSTYFINSSASNEIAPELGRQRAEDGEHALARLRREAATSRMRSAISKIEKGAP